MYIKRVVRFYTRKNENSAWLPKGSPIWDDGTFVSIEEALENTTRYSRNIVTPIPNERRFIEYVESDHVKITLSPTEESNDSYRYSYGKVYADGKIEIYHNKQNRFAFSIKTNGEFDLSTKKAMTKAVETLRDMYLDNILKNFYPNFVECSPYGENQL